MRTTATEKGSNLQPWTISKGLFRWPGPSPFHAEREHCPCLIASCARNPDYALSRLPHPANTPESPVLSGANSSKTRSDSSWQLAAHTASQGSAPLSKQGFLPLSSVTTSLPPCHKFKTIKSTSSGAAIYTSPCVYPSCMPAPGEEMLHFWAKHQVNTELLTVPSLWKETITVDSRKVL